MNIDWFLGYVCRRLVESMAKSAAQNYELEKLATDLEKAHLKLFKAQTECEKTKREFATQLNEQSDEKKILEASEALRNSLQ
jgi:septal ring factor EnvC (AmiA/AmiB activator)